MSTSSLWTFRTFKRFPEDERLLDDWNVLAETHGTPLLGPNWFAAAATAFHNSQELHIVVAYRAGRAEAIAPFVFQNRGALRHLEFIGMSALAEPCGIIYSNEAALEAFCRTLIANGKKLVLERIPSDGEVPTVLARLSRRKGLLVHRETGGSFYVDLRGGVEPYLASLSSRRRYDIRRGRKKLEKYGAVSSEIALPRDQDLDRTLKEFILIEDSGWKGRKGTSISSNKAMHKFVQHLATAAQANGTLRLAFLRIDGKAIAAQLSLEFAEKVWVLKIGYDEAYARCSPGLILTQDYILDASRRGLRSYEFLGSDEDWIKPWSTGVHEYCALVYYSPTLSGLVGLGGDVIGILTRRLSR